MDDAPIPSETTLSKNWDLSAPADYGDVLFKPEEMDLFGNKATCEIFVFHGKIVNYAAFERAEYDGDAFSVTIVHKDGRRLNLGIALGWEVRPYVARATEITFVQTKDGESVNGAAVPLVHAGEGA